MFGKSTRTAEFQLGSFNPHTEEKKQEQYALSSIHRDEATRHQGKAIKTTNKNTAGREVAKRNQHTKWEYDASSKAKKIGAKQQKKTKKMESFAKRPKRNVAGLS